MAKERFTISIDKEVAEKYIKDKKLNKGTFSRAIQELIIQELRRDTRETIAIRQIIQQQEAIDRSEAMIEIVGLYLNEIVTLLLIQSKTHTKEEKERITKTLMPMKEKLDEKIKEMAKTGKTFFSKEIIEQVQKNNDN